MFTGSVCFTHFVVLFWLGAWRLFESQFLFWAEGEDGGNDLSEEVPDDEEKDEEDQDDWEADAVDVDETLEKDSQDSVRSAQVGGLNGNGAGDHIERLIIFKNILIAENPNCYQTEHHETPLEHPSGLD